MAMTATAELLDEQRERVEAPIIEMPADEPAPPGWREYTEPTEEEKRLMAAVKARTSLTATSEIAEEEIPDVTWLVDGWIQDEGTAVIGGGPKEGKSFFALGLAVAVANGEPFMGRQTHQTGVIYCDLDHPSRKRYKQRMRQICGEGREPKTIFYAAAKRGQMFPRLDTIGHNTIDHLKGLRLEAKYTAGVDVRLIIIDVYNGIVPTASKNLDAYRQGRSELDPLMKWAHDEGIMILFVHHTHKARDTENPFNDLSGSNALFSVTDAGIILRRPVGAATTEMWTRSNDSESDGHYQITMQGGVFHMNGEAETKEDIALKEYYGSPIRRMITELVKYYKTPKGRLGSLKSLYEDLIGEPLDITPKAISAFLKEHREQFANLDEIDWRYKNNVFEFYRVDYNTLPGATTYSDEGPEPDTDNLF